MAKNDFQYGGWNYYTLQCGMWLWNRDSEFTKWQHPTMWYVALDDMPLNTPKRPPYWNSTSGYDFDHITAVDMSFCTISEVLSKSDHHRQKKMTSCRLSRRRISSMLDFRDPIMDVLKTPITTYKIAQFPENRLFFILASRSKMADLRHLGF